MTTFRSTPPAARGAPKVGAPSLHRWRRFAAAWLSASLLVWALAACGAQGPVGPAGPPGADGADGAANVIYSEWIPFAVTEWSAPVNRYGFTERRYDVAVPQLDAALLDQGLVFVYVRFADGSQFMLPYLGPVTSMFDQMLRHSVDEGRIRIAYFNVTNRTSDPGAFGAGNAFRYVLVPGGVPVGTALASVPHADGVLVAMDSTGLAPVEHGGR